MEQLLPRVGKIGATALACAAVGSLYGAALLDSGWEWTKIGFSIGTIGGFLYWFVIDRK